ncbi:MAG TPA: hypothetical protein VFI42_13840 [Thermomicrobiaceae bacterium]|nr:hypothetical protein [Thermomicrobiaceae bacterium]
MRRRSGSVGLLLILLLVAAACGQSLSATPLARGSDQVPAGTRQATRPSKPQPASSVATPSQPIATPHTLPSSAQLREGAAARAAAIDWATHILQARQPRAVSAQLLTVRAALPLQERAAGRHMDIWDPTTNDLPVWLVQLSGGDFHLFDCPGCAGGSTALLTLRADDGGLFWVALGSPPADQLGGLTQVFPPVPRDPRDAGGPNAVTPEEMGQHAIDYTRQRAASVKGDLQVLLSRPVTLSQLRQLGLNGPNFAPTCQRPLYLVILQGDVNARGLAPAPLAPGVPIPTHYLAYIFDLAHGAPGEIVTFIGSPTGSDLKQALHDPALPDPPYPLLGSPVSPNPVYGPCEDEYVACGSG